MTSTTITGDGHIAVPQEIFLVLNIRTGDTVNIKTMPEGSIRIFPKTLKASDVAGMLKTNEYSTIEEMDEAVAEVFKKPS